MIIMIIMIISNHGWTIDAIDYQRMILILSMGMDHFN